MAVAWSLVRSQLALMPAVSHSVESMLAAALAVGLEPLVSKFAALL
jgi:hypothetical protein